MNKLNLHLTLGAALWLAPATNTFAQRTWQTVADFQSVSFTAVDALTQDAAGNLYAAVSRTDAQELRHAEVRKSSDHGATWSTVEDTVSPYPSVTKYLSLGADAAGHLYAAGYVTDEKGETRWIVRKSAKGGTSWSTVDDFAGEAGQTTTAEGFAADSAGNVYVAGYADEPPSPGQSGRRMHWLVRQSRDGGRTWSTIDDFTHGFSARASAILSASGRLIVAGSGSNGKTKSNERWLVREGTVDQAGVFRWRTVDEFQLEEQAPGFTSRALGLGVDRHGNAYAVGRSDRAADVAVSRHWVVRRASSGESKWTTVDKFQLDPGYFASASGIAPGGQDGIYVLGQATGRNPGVHWIVRKSATGEAGSWSVSDDFRGVLPPAAKPAETVTRLVDGSMTSKPHEVCSGLAIVSDATHVFAGGSVSAASNHAIVRKLKLDQVKELTAASAR